MILTARRLLLAAALFAQPAGLSVAFAQAHTPNNERSVAPAGAVVAAEAADVPITSITLYRSGVGSFLREGTVQDDQLIRLRFRTEQVNDILKSMMVIDTDGGRVESATYGSKEPLERRLSSFAIDLSGNPDRADLLNQLRGASVTITTSDGKASGTVLGVERRVEIHDDHQQVIASLMLAGAAGVRSYDLNDVRAFEIDDPALAEELNKALLAVAEHRADTSKVVELSFRGQGNREVLVSYVHETPVWKTSYRLVLPEGDEGDGRMQGWAIVENTTDEDWSDVRLSLVAGQPVSFIMDLYEPLFITRPEIPVPTGVLAKPRVYGGAFEQANREDEAQKSRPQRAPEPSSVAARGLSRGAMESAAMEMDAAALGRAFYDQAPAAAASAGSAGEVFQYTLDLPVSIDRQQSAMLPIISSSLQTERVSIFAQNDGAPHPMRGVRITNDSELQLMPGPIAVYDGSAYAGDAQIAHVTAGDDRLLAYAVDLEVDAQVTNEQKQTVQRVRIVGGLLEQTLQRTIETTYTFDNDDAEDDRTIIVEHNHLEGWEYAGTTQPSERAQGVSRFELTVPASGGEKLLVSQQRTDAQSIALLNINEAQIAIWVRGGAASPAVLEAFRKAAEMQQAVNEANRQIQILEEQRQAIYADQERLRQNLAAVNRTSDLATRYLQRLSEQEDQLDQLNEQLATAQNILERRRQELQSYLMNLNVN